MRPPLSVTVMGGAACQSMMTISPRYFRKHCQFIGTSLKDRARREGPIWGVGLNGVSGRESIFRHLFINRPKNARLGRIRPCGEALEGVNLLGVTDFGFCNRVAQKIDRVIVGAAVHREGVAVLA